MRALASTLSRFGPLLALLVLVGLVAWQIPDFRKPENPLNIINQNAYVGIVAVGMTYVMILGGIDLSVGSMVALLAGLGALIMNWAVAHGLGPAPAIALGIAFMLAGGPLLGLLNGAVVHFGRVPPFIATLGAMAIFRSIVLAVADGGEIRVGTIPPAAMDALEPDAMSAMMAAGTSVKSSFTSIAAGGLPLPFTGSRGQALKLIIPTIVLLVMVVAGELILRRTVPGRRVFAVGDNPVAARYSGVKLGRTTLFAYTILGLCCGVAAVLNASRLASASSAQTGLNYELDAIAAVVIGGTAMRGGAGSVVGTLIGVLILGVINNALNLLSGHPYLGWMSNPHLQGAAKGCIIIAAVLLQRTRSPQR